MIAEYRPPKKGENGFTCPHCGVLSLHVWSEMFEKYPGQMQTTRREDICLSTCVHCKKETLWRGDALVYPSILTVERPHPDLPDRVAHDYREAADIVQKSPRGAAALLRLAMQELCNALDAKGSDLNEQIGDLVRRGLPVQIQQALDYTRVIGNNAVHPGEIDMRDNTDVAALLFGCVNQTCQVLIANPKAMDALFETLPAPYREQIKRRDEKNRGQAGSS